MAEVFLYNIGGEKLRKIRTALIRLGLSGRTVSNAEYGHPIGFLAGIEGFEPSGEYGGEDFTGEMLLMSGLSSRQFSALLDALRASRCTVEVIKDDGQIVDVITEETGEKARAAAQSVVDEVKNTFRPEEAEAESFEQTVSEDEEPKE